MTLGLLGIPGLMVRNEVFGEFFMYVDIVTKIIMMNYYVPVMWLLIWLLHQAAGWFSSNGDVRLAECQITGNHRNQLCFFLNFTKYWHRDPFFSSCWGWQMYIVYNLIYIYIYYFYILGSSYSFLFTSISIIIVTYYHSHLNTVDGRNPAPVDMVNIPLFTVYFTSQVVVWEFWTINSINSPHEQWTKPWLCRVYRGLHFPAIWGLLKTTITLPPTIIEVENGFLEDELSLQMGNCPLPWLLETEYICFQT